MIRLQRLCAALTAGFIAFVLVISVPALARGPVRDQFEGCVVKVKDGDSLLIRRRATGHLNEIRMAGIDAPEWKQPWGQEATAAMQELVLGKPVSVEVTDKDMYGRLVARVWQGSLYVNAAMTRSGNAWAFDRYLADPAIRAGQQRARKEQRGLWALPPQDRLPPPTWRARHPW